MNLTNLTNQVASQMLTDERITSHVSQPLSNKINKVGMVAVLALTAFLGNGFAHADTYGSGLNGVVGLLTGNTYNRTYQDPNGYEAQRQAQLDAQRQAQYQSQRNYGNVYQDPNGYEAQRQAQIDAQRQAQYQSQRNYGNVYQDPNGYEAQRQAQIEAQRQAQRNYPPSQYNVNNGNYGNYGNRDRQVYNSGNSNVRYATVNQSNSMPPQMVLYAVENHQGYVSHVSIASSPGVAALRGQRGGQDVYSNPTVQREMQETMNRMIQAHTALNNQSNSYLNVSRGASQNPYGAGNSRNYIEQENQRLQQALSNYSRERAFFAQAADNAANNGYNLSSYSNALNYLSPPPSVQVAYGGRNINRFSTLKTEYGNR